MTTSTARTGRGNLRPPDRDDITLATITDVTTATIRRRTVLGGMVGEHERAP
jgi:hypothetical protein